jgi:sugar lactone lactonase YvrE
LFNVWGVAVTSPGTFWLAQSAEVPVSPNNRVRKVTSFGNIQSVIGGGDGNGGAAINAQVDPRGSEAIDSGGSLPDLYFADGSYNMVRRVDGDTGIIDTIAGNGTSGYGGDGGAATNATLKTPSDVAVDAASGVVYVADTFNNVIRRIANGTITTFAGTGQGGYNRDNIAPTQANLNAPRGIGVDRFGNVFIADSENNRIRRVSGGQITTVAGNGAWGVGAENVRAVDTPLKTPSDVVVADDGTLYIADSASNRIRRVSPSGIITTFAGNGTQGFGGDGGLALNAKLFAPAYVSLDDSGNVFIADSGNNRVRRVSNGSIETVAGNGLTTTSGDGGSSINAGIGSPSGVAVDPRGGELFISAKDADRVRIVQFGGVQPPATPSFTATAIPQPNTPTRTPIQPTATNTSNPTGTPTSAPVSVNLSGEVTYYANPVVRVPNVQVTLSGPLPQTVLTNGSGTYSAVNMPTGSWEIQPVKVGSIGSAVSSLDAAYVLQYIAGGRSFSSLQQLACDVTGDGNVSVLDATKILQLSAGVINRLPAGQSCNSDWLFYPRPDPTQNQLVVTPAIAGGTCRQGNIELSPMLVTASHQDFEGILLGDCTGNWTQSIGGAFRLTAGGGITVNAGSLRRTAGSRLRLPIYVQSPAPFQAMDVKIGYDDSKLLFRSVRTHGAAIGALTGVNDDVPGMVALSMASAEQIDSNGAILIVEFASAADDADDAAVRLLSAQVDEQNAKVVTHSADD